MKALVSLFILILSASLLHAQENPPDSGSRADRSKIISQEELDKEFPLWARDLRRAEIVAFGSLPFTLFLSRIGVDAWRWGSNGWDSRYAAWPFKGTDAIEMSSKEARVSIAIACGASVLIAVADHMIVRNRRGKQVEREMQRPRSRLEIEAALDDSPVPNDDIAPESESDETASESFGPAAAVEVPLEAGSNG